MTAGPPPHPRAVEAIRAVHSAVFLVELGAIGWLVATGLLGRRDRTTAIAAALVGLGLLLHLRGVWRDRGLRTPPSGP